MSKRYRNSFKRTLCRWTSISPKPSYRNIRTNLYYNQNSPRLTPSPYPSSPYQRPPPTPLLQLPPNHYRDNIFTFSMSKYKLMIGSRTVSRENSPRRTSFHYRLAFVQKKEREEEKEKMKLQVRQRKFSLNVIQQPRKHRAKFIFTTSLPPTTPPNSSISDSKTVAKHFLNENR